MIIDQNYLTSLFLGLKIGYHVAKAIFSQNYSNNSLVNSNSPRAFVIFFLRKAAIVQHWGQQIHTKTPEWGKRLKMPHPEEEVKGMLFSKRLKIVYWHAVRKWSKQYYFTCESEK